MKKASILDNKLSLYCLRTAMTFLGFDSRAIVSIREFKSSVSALVYTHPTECYYPNNQLMSESLFNRMTCFSYIREVTFAYCPCQVSRIGTVSCRPRCCSSVFITHYTFQTYSNTRSISMLSSCSGSYFSRVLHVLVYPKVFCRQQTSATRNSLSDGFIDL